MDSSPSEGPSTSTTIPRRPPLGVARREAPGVPENQTAEESDPEGRGDRGWEVERGRRLCLEPRSRSDRISVPFTGSVRSLSGRR